MMIFAYLVADAPRDKFLYHREGEDIVRQTKIRVVRTHIGEHMQGTGASKKLKGTSAWDVIAWFR